MASFPSKSAGRFDPLAAGLLFWLFSTLPMVAHL